MLSARPGLWFVLILVAGSLLGGLLLPRFYPGVFKPLLKFLYPLEYEEIIFAKARERNVDPFLVAAIIHTESKFNPSARSPKGARGLMQIMPETGRWAAEKMNIGGLSPEDLDRPEINISIGTWYIAELRDQFGGTVAALAAYNAGRTHVRRWLDEGLWDGTLEGVDDIPYPETRSFVKRVSRAWRMYRLVHGGP